MSVAPLEMSLILQHCIVTEKYITLDDYNYRLTHFDYEYTEISKPSIVSRSTIVDGRSLKLSASQSLLLIRIFPFWSVMIFQLKVPTGSVLCYLPTLLISLCLHCLLLTFVQF